MSEEAIKVQQGFKEQPKCSLCHHCQRWEKNVNSPYEYRCNYAGNLGFTVDEDDVCLEFERV